MSNFKIGDKVKLKGYGFSSPYNYIQTEKEYNIIFIKESLSSGISLQLDNLSYFYPSYDFEVIKEEPPIVPLEFDITSDISRQFTRAGLKVDFIHNTKLNIDRPIVFHVEGRSQLYDADLFGKCIGNNDIITRPETKPSLFLYCETYLGENGGLYFADFKTLEQLKLSQTKFKETKTLMIELVEYNPNTNKVTRTEIPL